MAGSVVIVAIFTLGWIFALYALDRNWRRKGTGWQIPVMLLAGALSVIPTLWLYDLNPLWSSEQFGPFAYHFAFVGMTEEVGKFSVFVVVARLLRTIREPHDGIVQGAAIGVGFSAVEDVMYGWWYGPQTVLLRSVLIGVHAIVGAIMGYIWAAAVYENAMRRAPERYRLAVGGIVLVAIAHGLYNAVWSWFPWSEGIAVNALLLGGLILASARAYRSMLRRSPYHDFPYSESREALRIIAAGLRRDPGNTVLLRRLGVYAIAAGRYQAAMAALRRVRVRFRGDQRRKIDFLLGLARWCSGDHEAGDRLMRTAAGQLPPASRQRLAKEARALLPDRAMGEWIDLLAVPVEDRLRIPSEPRRTSSSRRGTSGPRTTSAPRRRYSSSRSESAPAARSAAQSA